MAMNSLPGKLSELLALAEDMADGAAAYGDTIGLVHFTETSLRAASAAVFAAESSYQTQRRDNAARATAQRLADSNVKGFIATARDVLKVHLGREYNPAWTPTGFPNNSLAIPGTLHERLTLTGQLKDYLSAHPQHQNVPLNVTAANAESLHEKLSDRHSEMNDSMRAEQERKAERDAAVSGLKRQMRGMIDELELKLGDMDGRWLAFGLNQPGAPESASAPENLIVNAMPGGFIAMWSSTPHAARYHVEILVMDADTQFRRVASVEDTDATVNTLTAGRSVRVRVRSVNDNGNTSAPSEEAIVVVG